MSKLGDLLIDRVSRRPPDFVIGDVENPYLRRWFIIPRNRWFNLYLHHFCRSDDDRALHDYPWANMSVLLRGDYIEVLPQGRHVALRAGQWTVRRAKAAHRIMLPIDVTTADWAEVPVWTLFITGPCVREWGFHCPAGWRHWKDFVSVREGGNAVGKGCGE